MSLNTDKIWFFRFNFVLTINYLSTIAQNSRHTSDDSHKVLNFTHADSPAFPIQQVKGGNYAKEHKLPRN